jgi:hypothetical protein
VVAKQNSPSRTSPTEREVSFRPEKRRCAAAVRFAPREHRHMHAGAQIHVGPSATGEDLWSVSMNGSAS